LSCWAERSIPPIVPRLFASLRVTTIGSF